MDHEQALKAKNLLIPNFFHNKVYSSIVGFGIGNKIIGNVDTGVLCVRVYVSKKLEREEIAQVGLLPQEIFGVPIDVVSVGNRFRPDGHLAPPRNSSPSNGITVGVSEPSGVIKPGASIAPNVEGLPNVAQGSAG